MSDAGEGLSPLHAGCVHVCGVCGYGVGWRGSFWFNAQEVLVKSVSFWPDRAEEFRIICIEYAVLQLRVHIAT